MAPKILVIAGPTASGKTKLAVSLAKKHNGEVISADSMQIYRKMNIGTAKPTADEMDGVPHHMLDIVDPQEDFSVARYVAMAAPIIDDVLARGKLPIVAGGTGLYIDSLISGRTFAPFKADDGLREQLQSKMDQQGGAALLTELSSIDPDTAARLHPNDQKRIIRALEIWHTTGKTQSQHDAETRAIPPRYDALCIGLAFRERAEMRRRIGERVDTMLSDGLLDEIRMLLDDGIPPTCTAMQAIGYKELIPALQNETTIDEAVQLLKLRTAQYAKRQLTWFARNQAMQWIYWGSSPDFSAAVQTSTEKIVDFGL